MNGYGYIPPPPENNKQEKRPKPSFFSFRIILLLIGLTVFLIIAFFALPSRKSKDNISGGEASRSVGSPNEEEQKKLHQLEEAKRIAAEKAAKDESLRLEELRRKMPENYEKAVALQKLGKYSEALPLLEELTKLDPNYKDVSTRVELARNKLTAEQNSALLSEAKKLSKSNSCSDTVEAANKLSQINPLTPDNKKIVEALLQNVREQMLSCYQGEGELAMAIRITKRRPLTLHVWIKNNSSKIRHANPTYFTLITESGESLPYSSDSFDYVKPFPAVELQPGTEVSGMVVFDTNDSPRSLIYQEMLGSRVSRNFP